MTEKRTGLPLWSASGWPRARSLSRSRSGWRGSCAARAPLRSAPARRPASPRPGRRTPMARAAAEVRSAFLATDVPDARERYERTSQALDAYAAAWAAMYRQTCEAEPAAGGRGGRRPARRLPRPARRGPRRARRRLRTRRCEGRAARGRCHAHAPAARQLRRRADDQGDRRTGGPGAAQPRSGAAQPAGGAVGDGRGGTGLASAEAGGHARRRDPRGEPRTVAGAGVDRPRSVRSPFDPEGAEPIYAEAFKRGEAIRNDELAAEAAIQLIAITGAIEHHSTAASAGPASQRGPSSAASRCACGDRSFTTGERCSPPGGHGGWRKVTSLPRWRSGSRRWAGRTLTSPRR